MKIHQNALTTRHGRAEIVRRVMEQRQPSEAVAAALGSPGKLSPSGWRRYRAEGEDGLADRSSCPRCMLAATPADVAGQIVTLRCQRITGKHHGQASRRRSGWEFVHVGIDDASRIAFS